MEYKSLSLNLASLSFLLKNYIKYREYSHIKNESIPKEVDMFSDIWKIEKSEYVTTLRYNREKMVVEFIENIILFAIMINVWNYNIIVNFYNDLDSKLNNQYYTIILFTLICSFVSKLLSIPFGYYRIFYIEEKYNFNKSTRKLFFKDLVIGYVIGSLIECIFYCLFNWVMVYFQDKFINYLMVLYTIFMLLIIIIYPNYIAPLYNKFELLNEENEKEKNLKQKISQLMTKYNYPLNKIYKIDGSKRTSHSNAYFFGLFKTKQLVLFDTLFEKLDNDEIMGIVAHELGHCEHHHMYINIFMNLGIFYFICFVFKFLYNNSLFYSSFGLNKPNYFIGITIVTSLIMESMSLLIQLLFFSISRKNEFQADEFAFNNNSASHLKRALVKLFKDNKGIIVSDYYYSMFNHSHPNLIQRLQRLNNLEKNKKKIN